MGNAMKNILSVQPLLALLAVLSLAVCVMPAEAQIRRDLAVVPQNQAPGVNLSIDIGRPTLRIGERVQICFSASQSGYVTMWNIGTSGDKPTRIYPFTRQEGPAPVEAGRRYCAGTPDQEFAFQVKGPTGMEDTYLVWTRTPEAQPRAFYFPDARQLSKDLEVVESLPRTDWSTAHVTYEIVSAAGPQAPQPISVLPAPPTQGRVFVLSMGANVQKLTKAVQDSRQFSQAVQRMFNVPQSQIRVIENVYKRQFQEAFAWLQQNVRPGDVVYIFFSGHGFTLPDDDGDEADGLDEAFVTYDAEGSSSVRRSMLVTDDEFAAWVRAVNTDNIITVLDTCHSGGLHKSLLGLRTKTFIAKDLVDGVPSIPASAAAAPQAGGIDLPRNGPVRGVVLAAAQENEFALEGPQGGLFVSALIRSWTDGRSATLRQSFDWARREAQTQSRNQQTPTLAGDLSLLDRVKLR